jgi:hypothetical protein
MYSHVRYLLTCNASSSNFLYKILPYFCISFLKFENISQLIADLKYTAPVPSLAKFSLSFSCKAQPKSSKRIASLTELTGFRTLPRLNCSRAKTPLRQRALFSFRSQQREIFLACLPCLCVGPVARQGRAGRKWKFN